MTENTSSGSSLENLPPEMVRPLSIVAGIVGGVIVLKLDHSKMYQDVCREKVIRWMEEFSKAVPDDLLAPMKMLDDRDRNA